MVGQKYPFEARSDDHHPSIDYIYTLTLIVTHYSYNNKCSSKSGQTVIIKINA